MTYEELQNIKPGDKVTAIHDIIDEKAGNLKAGEPLTVKKVSRMNDRVHYFTTTPPIGETKYKQTYFQSVIREGGEHLPCWIQRNMILCES